MIKNYLPILFKFSLAVLSGVFAFSLSFGQVANNNTEDLIIHIEHFNFEKQLGDLTNKLYVYKGSHIVGYCKTLEVIMFRININLQEDDTKMFETLKSAGYVFQIKEHASIDKVEAACHDKREDILLHEE
jgi:hypothetical protein